MTTTDEQGLLQVIDTTVPEADDLKQYTQVNNDGTHFVELVAEQQPCELCDDEVELADEDGAVVVKEQETYRLKGVIQTSNLCREHLAAQTYHVAFVEMDRGEA